jgi:Fic family protein
MMLHWAKAGEPLSVEKLVACHSELMKGAFTKDGNRFQSRYRLAEEMVHADLHTFPDSNHHEEDVGKILAEMNSSIGTVHPVKWSCDLLLAVVSAQPFLNGNGRMARLCYAYGLARHGVPCAVVCSDWHSKARGHYLGAVKDADGQRGGIKKKVSLYTMGTVGLYNALHDMAAYCERSNIE